MLKKSVWLTFYPKYVKISIGYLATVLGETLDCVVSNQRHQETINVAAFQKARRQIARAVFEKMSN